MAAETRARFAREIDATARLVHKNVLALIEAGVDDATGAPYLVMPRMRGEDLGQLLARVKVLEPSVAVPLVIQACRGIAAGHAAGIIHRDVKPSNLFLEEEDGLLVVKVSDFGLAKVQDAGIESLTSSGALLGTPHYMSPEQAENAKRVDARTDVFSLGMVLFHALTGNVAFSRSGSFMAFLVGQAHVRTSAGRAVGPALDRARGPRGAPPFAGRALAERRRARARSHDGGRLRDGARAALQGVARAGLPVDARRRVAARDAPGALGRDVARLTNGAG